MPIRKMYDGEYLIGRVVEDSKEKWRVELDDETYDYLTTSEITQGRHGKNVTIGYRFKLTYEGKLLTGQVVDLKPKTVWRVDFIDGSSDHLELSELCRVRQFRNHLSAPSNGRQMCGFELCCGRGVVTEAFMQRKWQMWSNDIDPWSNAHCVQNLHIISTTELPFAPDFIWWSPPCKTHSRLAANIHRNPKAGQYAMTPVAHEHDELFCKGINIFRWVIERNPNVIIVIENPSYGSMREMPLMIALAKEFKLNDCEVDYCAFGREYKKPTRLWVNHPILLSKLNRFTCMKNCSQNGVHGCGARGNSDLDHGVIPSALADEVAKCVDAICYNEDRQWQQLRPM